MFSLICAWINDWVNTREAGGLRRRRAHYDVIEKHAFSRKIAWFFVNSLGSCDAHTYMRLWSRWSLDKIMAYHLFGAKPCIIWASDDIGSLILKGTYFNGILFGIPWFLFKEMHFRESVVSEMSTILFRPQCANLHAWELTLFQSINSTVLDLYHIRYVYYSG